MLKKCGFAAHFNIELAVRRVRPIGGQGLLLCRAYGSERTARSTTDTK